VILRDDGNRPQIIDALRRAKHPDVLVYEPDLSPPALMDAMAHDVAQPGLPEAQRMQMLTELASLDYAYGTSRAGQRQVRDPVRLLRRHQVQAMQAFVLQGIGMSMRRLDRLAKAKERYAQGLTLALTTRSLPLIMGLAYASETSAFPATVSGREDHLEIARRSPSACTTGPWRRMRWKRSATHGSRSGVRAKP